MPSLPSPATAVVVVFWTVSISFHTVQLVMRTVLVEVVYGAITICGGAVPPFLLMCFIVLRF